MSPEGGAGELAADLDRLERDGPALLSRPAAGRLLEGLGGLLLEGTVQGLDELVARIDAAIARDRDAWLSTAGAEVLASCRGYVEAVEGGVRGAAALARRREVLEARLLAAQLLGLSLSDEVTARLQAADSALEAALEEES